MNCAVLVRALSYLRVLEKSGIRWRVGPSACADQGTYVGHVWHERHPHRVLPVVSPTLDGCLAAMAERGNHLAVAALEKTPPATKGCGRLFTRGQWLLRCVTSTAEGVQRCPECEGSGGTG